MRCIFRRGKTTNTDPQCCFMCFAAAWRQRLNGACKWGVQRWRLLYRTHRSASQLLDIWGEFRPLGSPDVGPAGPKLNPDLKSSGSPGFLRDVPTMENELTRYPVWSWDRLPPTVRGIKQLSWPWPRPLLCLNHLTLHAASQAVALCYFNMVEPQNGFHLEPPLILSRRCIILFLCPCVHPSSSPPSVARRDDWWSCNGSPAGALNPSCSVLFQCGLIQNVSPTSSSSSSNSPPPLPRSRVEVSCGGEGADSGRRVQAGLPCRVWNGDACQLCKARLSPRISLAKHNLKRKKKKRLSELNAEAVHHLHISSCFHCGLEAMRSCLKSRSHLYGLTHPRLEVVSYRCTVQRDEDSGNDFLALSYLVLTPTSTSGAVWGLVSCPRVLCPADQRNRNQQPSNKRLSIECHASFHRTPVLWWRHVSGLFARVGGLAVPNHQLAATVLLKRASSNNDCTVL